MKPRFLWAALLLMSAAVSAAQEPVVRETQPRKPAKGDPALNPASANPHPGLSARALAQGARREREPEKAHWASARWTRALRSWWIARNLQRPSHLRSKGCEYTSVQ